MDALERLNGPENRFDRGFPLNATDNKALRDAIIYLYNKVKELEEKLPKKKAPKE